MTNTTANERKNIIRPNSRQMEALCREKLSIFIRLAFSVLEPYTEYHHSDHIDLISDRLMGTLEKDIAKRLIINMPPRMMKSICASIAFPAWVLGKYPSKKIMCISYSEDLARDLSMKTQKLMESGIYKHLFPKAQLSNQRQTQLDLRTTKGGGRYAASTGGAIAGFGADIIIIDDPIKPSDANYKKLENCNRWFEENIYQRLNNKNTGIIVIVMQRVHENDLTGFLQDKANNGGTRYLPLILPAIAESYEENTFWYGGIYKRNQGEALHPERESIKFLKEAKNNLGSYTFAGQYQQRPAPAGETIVKGNWFNRYKQIHLNSFSTVIQSWDTAMTANDTSDYSVGITIGMLKSNSNKMTFYILDVIRKKMEFPEVLKAIKAFSKEYARRRNIIVEDAGHGKAVIQSLRQDGIPINAHKPMGDKHTRLISITDVLESGFVYLPEKAPWLDDFLLEVTRFPNAKHDDQVDALSQGINWFKEGYRKPVRVIRNPPIFG